MDNLSVKEKEIYGSLFTWQNGLAMIVTFGTAYLALINGLGGQFSVLWLLIAGMFTSKMIFGKWLSVFRTKTDKFSFVFWLGLTFVIAILVTKLGDFLGVNMVSNPIEQGVGLGTLIGMVPALMGEELLVTVPMMFFLGVAVKHGNTKPWVTILLIVLTSLMFGALHLPTYGWNYYQALIGITLVRIPFTLATLQAGSIKAGFAVHYAYDAIIVLLMIVGS